MDINYSKSDNKNLFSSFEKMNLYDLQNYVPIYKLFFKMNNINYNSINIQIPEKILSIEKNNSYNVAEAYISTPKHTKRLQKIFIKYAPIIDPIRYMAGKYKDINMELPLLEFQNNNSFFEKINNKFNSSYVDGFFSYISSTLYNNGFINGLNFYGMYIGYQKSLKINIIDDLEFLSDSSYFHNNLDNLFHIENSDIFSIDSGKSGNKKNKIVILDESIDNFQFENLDDIQDNNIYNENFVVDLEEINKFNILDEFYNIKDDSSTCSSASSLTHLSDLEINELNSDTSNDMSNGSTIEIEVDDDIDDNDSSEISYVEGVIDNMPVTIICTEKCENTLEYLIENDLIKTNEWVSCLMQIIVTLIVYQNIYNFTHNDLHTSNVMYCKTHLKYVYYKIDNSVYKVPTYGKIYKVIDFGRSIYTFKDILVYSDAFNKKEDAATQYNFGPVYDNGKPEILPNNSFDLCRLSCSLYDYFNEFYDINNKTDELLRNLINSWCSDDKGKNILYKSSGEERYPEFKLYKMIARTVHNCIPKEQLKNKLFSKYITLENNQNIIDINNL
jgi:hypothetical protein